MGAKLRSFNVKFRCYVDPEIHKGFNIAVCLAGDLPSSNPIVQMYINPEHNPDGWYTYTFVDMLMDEEKTYEVWVQSVAVNKDSMWRSVSGVEVPDDGIGSIGGSITDITQAELDEALAGLEIDGNNTNIISINGGNINANSIKAESVDCVNLAVSGLAIINEAYIGGVHIKDNTITADKINVNDLIVNGIANIQEAYIGGVHIKDNTITANKVDVVDLAVSGLATVNEAYIAGVHIVDNTVTANKVDVIDLAVRGLANITEAYIGGVHIKDSTVKAINVDTVDLAVSGLATINVAYIGGVQIKDNAIKANNVDVVNLAVTGLANITEAFISGVHIKDNTVKARSIDTTNLAVSGLAAITEAYVGGVHLYNNTITANKVNVVDLAVSGLATINEAYISGVHINSGSISAVNIDVSDLAVSGLANITEAYIGGAHIANGAIKTSHIGSNTIKAANIDTNDLQVNGAATVNALLSNNAVISGSLVIGESGQLVMDGSQIFSKNGISGPGYSLSASGLTASSGQIATWFITPDVLKSRSTGARIELDQNRSRVSVIDGSNNTKVAMGYLNGLQKYDGSGTWTSSDYGFWASKGNNLRIEGDIKYENGDWIIQNDGAYLIKDSLDKEIVRLGTDEGETGLFMFSHNEEVKTRIAKYTSSEILLGEEDAEGVLISGLRFTKDGGLEVKGKITVTDGSDLGEVIPTGDLGTLAYLNTVANEHITSISGSKITTASISANRMVANQTFVGHTIQSANYTVGALGWSIKSNGTFEFNGDAGKRISFDGTTFALSVPIAATDVSDLGELALKDTIVDADVTSISGGKIVTGSIAADKMLANQTFIGHTIQSTNYAIGSAGWKIANDGKFAFHGPDDKSFTFDGSNFIFSGPIMAASNVYDLGTMATLDAVDDSNITSISGGKITAGTIAADKIASNQSFIGHSIQSSNYAAGSAGWLINRNGTFEFNGSSGNKISFNGTTFAINAPIAASSVNGLGDLAILDTVPTGKVDGLGDLALLDTVSNSYITSVDGGKITTNTIVANKIASNQTFIGHSIQSSNYVANSAGWKISSGGTFEFNKSSTERIAFNGSAFTLSVPIAASNVDGLGDLALLDTVSNTKITSIDGAKITTGYIAAARINANTITTTMINASAVTIPVYATGGYLLANGSLQTVCSATITTGAVAARVVVLVNARVGYTDLSSRTEFFLYRGTTRVLEVGMTDSVNDFQNFMYSEVVNANTTVTYYVKWTGKASGCHIVQSRINLQGAMR